MPLAGFGGGLKYPRLGRHAPDVGHRRVAVVAACLGKVHLADNHHVRRLEHRRILQRLVLPLGYRQQHDAQVLAQIVGRRADQVADVLDDQQVEPGQVEPLDGASRPFRLPGDRRCRW